MPGTVKVSPAIYPLPGLPINCIPKFKPDDTQNSASTPAAVFDVKNGTAKPLLKWSCAISVSFPENAVPPNVASS